MKVKSAQAVQSNKNMTPNPQTIVKTQSINKGKQGNEANDQKTQSLIVLKQDNKASQDDEENALKKIQSAQLFFNKKFLGNKDLSKAIMIKNLLKAPKLFNPQKIISLKTGNLSDKIKQIQTIFKAQKRNKHKKSHTPSVMTDFQIYITKRDVLKEKNQFIDQIRILYEEDKKKLQQKKNKKKRKFSTEEAEQKQEPQNLQSKPYQKSQLQSETQTQNLPQLLFPGLYQQVNSPQPQPEKPEEHQQNDKEDENEMVLLKKQEDKLVTLKPFEDEYFQRKFEEKIVKNKINVDTTFTLKSLFKSFDNRKTTLNKEEFIKHELNQIEYVATATIKNFEVKEKIDRQLYGQDVDFDRIESQLTSKRTTPASLWTDNKTDRKSINWIIKECDGFKKKFNVRKTQSLKKIIK